MGTWGSGNLENDSALDIIGERSTKMTHLIWDSINSEGSTEADEDEHTELFINIDTLVALDSVGLFSGWEMPSPLEFDAAIQIWLKRWDAYFDGMGSTDEFRAERRAVIEKTFAKFRLVLVKNDRTQS